MFRQLGLTLINTDREYDDHWQKIQRFDVGWGFHQLYAKILNYNIYNFTLQKITVTYIWMLVYLDSITEFQVKGEIWPNQQSSTLYNS